MTSLADLKVPGPTITALTEPFWRAASEGHLMIQKCKHCAKAVFYPRALCPHCWSDALSWCDASGLGTLKSFSQIWKPGHPGWLPAAPYVVGLVELAEGPTMLTHIVNNHLVATLDQPLRFAPTNIGGRILPCFELVNQKGGVIDELRS